MATTWRLTLEEVARYPRPGTNVPSNLAFSPDGRLLTYLWSERGDLVRDLWALDLVSGQRRVLVGAPGGGISDENVNPEEALRRERQRLREGGVTHYSWPKSADRLLVPINSQLFVTSSAGEPLRALAPSDEPAVDARLSPDGRQVVFVRARELWVVDTAGGEARRLTHDATATVSNGLAEYVAQEEMGRDAGFWIAPDGRHLAYAQVDEGHIPPYPIVHQGGDTWRVEKHRYPFAGGENAHVRLGVLPLPEGPGRPAGGATRWLDLGPDPDCYLARVDWRPDGRLLVQVQSRDQRRLELRLFDVADGSCHTLLLEEGDPWINLHADLRFVGDRGDFLWSSERTGFRHLELRDARGGLVRTLTAGEWPVDRVAHLDPDRGWVYFLAGRESPLERHLYRVPLAGGQIERLTHEPGFHAATFSADGRWYAHHHESRTAPPSVRVRSADGAERWPLHVPLPTEDLAPGLAPPELVALTSRDGARLYGAMYRPHPPIAHLPTLICVYGGPHAQMVNDTWGMTVDLRAQYLAAQGFLVFKLDNRGSARRGLAFEASIARRMGGVEVQDQVDGVRWLVEQGLADPNRVGIYGWSYGGYMTLLCLMKAPETFKAGVAGAPVTAWDGYDTHYTERYMGTPQQNPEGYRESSALSHADKLDGRLLIVHGMIDENVHFRHTARLVTALETANRPFDLLVFPNERHMPRGEDARRYLEERLVGAFKAWV